MLRLNPRINVLLLALVALLTGVLARHAAGVRLERSNESMVARSDEQQRIYDDFRERFGSDEILLVAMKHPRLLQPEGLRSLEGLTDSIATIEGVRRVDSLTSVGQLVHTEEGAVETPLVQRPFDRPDLVESLEAALRRNPRYTDLLVSADRRIAGIAVEIENRAGDDAYRGRVIEELRALLDTRKATGEELHLTGITVQKHDTTRLVARDQSVLLPVSAMVLAAALALMFRRWSGVWLPLLITTLAIVWTLGIYAATGHTINVVTSLLPPVVMVLSIATSVHLYQKWIDLERRVPRRYERVYGAVWTLFAPCGLATLTTALGLLSLTVSDIPAVRQFGVFAALGITIAFVLNFTLFPVVLSLLQPAPRGATGRGDLLDRVLRSTGNLSVQAPRRILALTVGLSIVALAGASRIRSNTDLIGFLRGDTPLVQDTRFIDRNLTGTNSLELLVQRRDGAALVTPDDVHRLAEFQRDIGRQPAVTSVLGITDVLEQLHRAETGGEELRLPDDPDDLLYCFDLLEIAEERELIARLITDDFTSTRVTARIRAIGSAAAASLLQRVRESAARRLGPDYEAIPTGGFHQITVDSNRLVTSQVKSFGLALVTVLLVMGLAFRSAGLLLAALIPNVVPILWTAGLMGATGIDLSVGTTMIASVVLGIAVDDTIHYLARFRRERKRGLERAIHATTARTGRALVVASIVLALGFWVGCFGSFKPTIYFSLLSGATILGALVCDLLVLPACLLLLRSRG